MINTSFDFTLGIAPKGSSIQRDMQYIKAALLYADTISLISPTAFAYFYLTDESDRKDEKTILKLIEKVMPLWELSDPAEAAKAQSAVREVGEIINSKKWKSAPMPLKLEIRSGMKKFGSDISNTLSMMLGESNCSDLIKLVKAKKIKLYKFENQIFDKEAIIIDEFFKILSQTIADSKTYPLFDEGSNNLIDAAVRENKISLNDVNADQAKHAGLANNLMVSLPTFELSTVDEILDIRNELESPLVRFRSKVISFNQDIQSLPWSDDFEPECIKLYHKEIAPAILEIDELTKDSSFLKNLGYKLLSDESILKAAGGLAIAVAASGVMSAFTSTMASDTAIYAAGGAYAASKVANTYKEFKEKKKNTQRKDLYFYYKAGKLLTK